MPSSASPAVASTHQRVKPQWLVEDNARMVRAIAEQQAERQRRSDHYDALAERRAREYSLVRASYVDTRTLEVRVIRDRY